MAIFADTPPMTTPSLWSRFAAGCVAVMERSAEAQSRSHQMRALERKSDAELAEMGLRRDDIARYVFSDLLYI